MNANETDHRFLGLGVDEVSLVDHPANEEEWLTIKRLEDKPMADETKNVKETQADNEETKAVKKSTDETKGTEAVEKNETEAASESTEGAAEDSLLQKIESVVMKALGGNADETKVETKKSLMGFNEDGELVINAELLQDVQKARSFTGKRIGAITDATKAMLKLLGEVAPDEVKKLVEVAPKPDVVPAKKSVEEQEVSEKPDIGEDIVEAVSKALGPFNDRLKVLEGTRGTPKSKDDDQTADITKRDDNKSIFAGVV